jgi:ornithine cyclodeaminase/alanine dehydrogenase
MLYEEGHILKPPETLILKRGEIASLLTLQDYLQAVEDAFRMHAEGRALAPGLLHVDAHEGEFHIKAGGLDLDKTYFGLKVNGSFFKNRERYGLPAIQGVVILFDGEMGAPLAIMDSIEITIQRTGAAAAVAAKYLAREDSHVATICGCGNQGRVQLRALKLVRPITQAFGYDVDPAFATRYAEDMTRELGIPVVAMTDLRAAAQKSDVVITCTPSKKPYLMKDFIRPGTFVAAVGADSPDKQEVESSLLVGNKLVVDILDQCATVGELHHALDAGLMTRADVYSELGPVVAGKVPGRTSRDEITVFDATGTALQDVAAAVQVYKKSLAAGIGIKVSLAGMG